MVAHDRRANFDREASGSGRTCSPIPNGFIMAAKKQPKRKNGCVKAAASASGHFPIVLSTAVWSALNMTAVVTTSGSVLLFLLTAKRFL
jgi:hypothetical protein